MMKRSIVMTSDPFAMPVRGKGDRTAPIGPENRDAVSSQPLEDLGGGVPVVVVPADADHGFVRRQLVQPLVRRRGPRPVMTDLPLALHDAEIKPRVLRRSPRALLPTA